MQSLQRPYPSASPSYRVVLEALIGTYPGDLIHTATQDKTKIFMKTSLTLAACNALCFLILFHYLKCGSQPTSWT